jgi:ketosteroid isomerase-like protein
MAEVSPLRDTQGGMSEESTTADLVELTRAGVDVVNRGDLDAVMSFYAPDAVWESQPLGTSFAGVEAIRGAHEDWLGAYEQYEIRTDEILELCNGVVFAVVRQNARPVGSSCHVQTRNATTSEWENGEIARVTLYYAIDEARAAAERLPQERT